MKYFIVSSFEVEGHSGASAVLCSSESIKQEYLQSILYDSEKKTYYPTSGTHQEEDGSTTMYGEWTCGRWSINILPFKTFKEITNRERYSQTG